MRGGQKTIVALCREAAQLVKAKYWQLVGASSALVIAAFVMSIVIAVVYFAVYLLLVPTAMFGGVLPAVLLPQAVNGGDRGDFPGMIGISIAAFVLVAFIVLLLSFAIMVVALICSIVEQTVEVSIFEAMLLVIKGDKPTLNAISKNFGKNWKRYLGISAWSTLWTFLWSLLLIFPGVIKGCSYMLAPYLVVQYPDMTVKQALKKSMEITNGYKGRLFLVSLITIGSLYIVALCLFCIPFSMYAAMLFWIYPFYFAMLTIAYLDIKQAAVENGLLPAGTACVSDSEGGTAV